MNILRSFSELVFPRTCELCGCAVDRPARHVCSACLARIPFAEQEGACRVCGKPVVEPGPELLCSDCAGPDRPAFDRASSALVFEGRAREAVLDFKYHRHFWMRDDLTDWVEAAARARFDVDTVDCVVPVPTTVFHLMDRGYFPVDLLARPLARRLGRKYLPRTLYRRGNPFARQSALDEEARREKIVGTVGVRQGQWLRGRTVLVVDDIFTTGATLSECARMLKGAGAWRVWCVTLARSVRL